MEREREREREGELGGRVGEKCETIVFISVDGISVMEQIPKEIAVRT